MMSKQVNMHCLSMQVWRRYVCNTSVVNGNEICITVGRLTPSLYNQFNSSVKVSRGLYHYAPFLARLADCTFVRETFTEISRDDCPGLSRYSRWVYAGLALISAAVMLSLIFWVVYARERRHRKHSMQFIRSEQEQAFGQPDKV